VETIFSIKLKTEYLTDKNFHEKGLFSKKLSQYSQLSSVNQLPFFYLFQPRFHIINKEELTVVMCSHFPMEGSHDIT
jgi:hypothetical protein